MSYPRSLPSSYKPFGPNHDRPESSASNGCRRLPSINDVNSNAFPPFLPGIPPMAPPSQMGYLRSSDCRYRSNNPNNPSHFPGSRYNNCPPNSSNNCGIDENRNPIYDEALNFVSSSQSLPRLDSRNGGICAAFVKEHFTCPVCLDVLIEATIIPCGHQFCRHCLDTWLEEKPVCPVCQKSVNCDSKQYDYDVDNAIESVSHHLSEEWKARRQCLKQVSPRELNTGTQSFSFAVPHRVVLAINKAKQNVRTGWEWLKNIFFYTIVAFLIMAEWVYDHVSLEQFAQGVLITCVVTTLVYFGNSIVNFTQYMYYAMRIYRKNVPVLQQITAIYGDLGPDGYPLKPKFQEFVGLKDTIFAHFLELFYKKTD